MDLRDEITLRKVHDAQGVKPKEYIFNLALENWTKSTSARGIDIKLDFFWEGDRPQHAIYITPWRKALGWQATCRELIHSQPAVLQFRGTENDRCPYGQALRWYNFRIRLHEDLEGHFRLHYSLSCAEPPASAEGSLRIIME